jgi:plastocyanin domain-containing protein
MKQLIGVTSLLFVLASPSGLAAKPGTTQVVEVAVTEDGFSPSPVKVQAGKDVTLRITRKTDSTCARKVQIPSKKLNAELPLNKPVDLKLGKLEKGEIKFGCGMDMMVGAVVLAE